MQRNRFELRSLIKLWHFRAAADIALDQLNRVFWHILAIAHAALWQRQCTFDFVLG
jgi:hypothetical protein